jgi:ATP adenylyltransferase
MDIIRAPWRMEYIDSSSKTERSDIKNDRCIFCEYPKESDDEENLILQRGKTAFVLLNRYPYSVGHLLIAPYRHTADFPSLSDDEKLEIISLAQFSVSLLERIMNADGFNIGMNIGRIAGAGIDTHLHLHIVPRWNGDINFMSVTAETKVLPEALKVTRKRLVDEWKNSSLP